MSATAVAPSSALRAVTLDGREDAAEWDRFVETCPEATFFHRSGWKNIMENVFGHETFFLSAQSEDGIEGVLPLGRIRSSLFGDSLISVPFGVYGGVAALTERARELLLDEAVKLASAKGVDYLELRNRTPVRDWPAKELYVTFRKEILPDPDDNMKAIPRKQRAMVRKGLKAGLESTLDDDVDRFFMAYATSVRNLGTPVYPKKYYGALLETFRDDCEIMTVTKDGRTVASVMTFYFRDEVVPYYGGGTGESRPLKANDFMYWELLRRSAERGYRVFDYGRSKLGTGSFSFKKNWGFEPEPLPYQYYLVNATEVPNVSPTNPKYQFFVRAWQRLPLRASIFLGPWVSRHIG